MLPANAHVPEPEIALTDGTPVSVAYDDVYFSRAGGVAETTHVFLQGNDLPARFAEKRDFTIAELGFGTGLNFLVAWACFLRDAPADYHLHYLAVEKFPLTRAMLEEALALHPELAELTAQLLQTLPLRLPGMHRIHLPRVTLTLLYGDVAELLPQLDIRVDAWFLDGFSPAKNAAMWSDEVFAQIGRLSTADASFATFTAAGFVKRGLAGQGFAIAKVPGYGHKREMLTGRRSGEALSREYPTSAVIIGGGIAGCTLAHRLAERGVRVTLLERNEIASGASGNPGAVLFPQLTKRWTVSAAWYFAAYGFMLQQLLRWKEAGVALTFVTCGMLRLPRHAEEEAQLRAMGTTLGLDASIVRWVEQAEATDLAGVKLMTGGAFFPQGTWLSPVELCRGLAQHENITVHEHTTVISCVRECAQWHIKTDKGAVFAAEHCCITTAQDAAAFFPEFELRLHAVGGQVSVIAEPPEPLPLRTILCHKGYVIPLGKTFLTGATYSHGEDALAVTEENHQKNLAEVAHFLPQLAKGTILSGRTSLRATTPDRLPYVGKLAEGLWVSSGHGSRGMLSAPLAAEAIVSEIFEEQVPLTYELRAAVYPLRFKKA